MINFIQQDENNFEVHYQQQFVGTVSYSELNNSELAAEHTNLPTSCAVINFNLNTKLLSQVLSQVLSEIDLLEIILLFYKQQIFTQFEYGIIKLDASATQQKIINYQKAGFFTINNLTTMQNIYMIKYKLPIRLYFTNIEAIKQKFIKYFLATDQLWIFGSRVDLTKKGGDLDLYIETNITDYDAVFNKKSAFLNDLKQAIGDQKIDVVVNVKNSGYEIPIYQAAKSEGVRIL
jgi:hypothetical protein